MIRHSDGAELAREQREIRLWIENDLCKPKVTPDSIIFLHLETGKGRQTQRLEKESQDKL